ncbi:MAG: hypothetical protein R3F65_09375 [bacterium]
MDAHGPLERVLALEAAGVDDADGYASALRDLAAALRADDAVEIANRMTFWLIPALGLDLGGPPADDRWREALWDAAVDALADAGALARYLETIADRLRGRRPSHLNLLAMLRTRVGWRAKDKLRRRDLYRQRYGGDYRPEGAVGALDDHGRRVAALCVERVEAAFAGGGGAAGAGGVARGGTVSEVSRQTGISRQRIYRLLARMRAFVEGGHELHPARCGARGAGGGRAAAGDALWGHAAGCATCGAAVAGAQLVALGHGGGGEADDAAALWALGLGEAPAGVDAAAGAWLEAVARGAAGVVPAAPPGGGDDFGSGAEDGFGRETTDGVERGATDGFERRASDGFEVGRRMASSVGLRMAPSGGRRMAPSGGRRMAPSGGRRMASGVRRGMASSGRG